MEGFEGVFKNTKSSEEIESARTSEQSRIAEQAAMDQKDLAGLTLEKIYNEVQKESVWGYAITGTIKGLRLTMRYSSGIGGERSAHIEGKNPVTGVEINQDLPQETTNRLFDKLFNTIVQRDGVDKEASFRAQEMHEKETLADIFSGTAAEALFVSTAERYSN